ncbi:putative purine nucleoside phosphorylase [Candidatus Protochlamydia naegleriophila]|uniref:Uridine phosphorylase n=1 Tax=Candidatus Protochlamydia naegleriophila TaxID=389348 RepID=A0A0U5JC05_9BACT|nr:nucleoside phosphorylase [Candidatus Protochlamydia naegleriophila]CUI17400.1 putative purine nucleoside phosphorylase [Candidatus Protochlamydia naegleriophila]
MSSFCSSLLVNPIANEPIVTAEKYMAYKKRNGHLIEFIPPAAILVCYQQSSLKYLLDCIPEMEECETFSNLYLIDEGRVGILGGWGIGAPALSVKLEQLIALGAKTFIAVGTAGTLMNHPIGDFIIAPKALAEDGVAHLYLKDSSFAQADDALFSIWNSFIQSRSLPHFHSVPAWSFSALFRETPADICRVTKLGCGVVEMEAATLYAIGQEKGVQTLSLFVVSDTLTQENWIPHIKEPAVKHNLHRLAKWALEFCQETILDKYI